MMKKFLIILFLLTNLNTNLLKDMFFSSNLNLENIHKNNFVSKTGGSEAFSKDWRKMNITFDLSNIEHLKTDNPVFYSVIKYALIPKTKEYFSQALKVRGFKSFENIRTNRCFKNYGIEIPNSYKNKLFETDLLIFIKAEFSSEGFNAFAASCLNSSFDFRPLVGFIVFNVAKLGNFTKNSLKIYSQTMLHEVVHILGLSQNTYSKFIDEDRIQKRKEDTVRVLRKENTVVSAGLITNKLITYARNYFNCEKMDEIPLNVNNNGNYSHFGRLLLGPELMIPVSTAIEGLSKFTLNFLDDTGWYFTEKSHSFNISWGYKKGCDFVDNLCDSKFKEFCRVEGEMACSDDHRFKLECEIVNDNCLIFDYRDRNDCINTENFDYNFSFEKNGPKSKCFDIKKKNDVNFKPVCLETDCKENYVNITSSDGFSFQCIFGEFMKIDISGDEFEILCPEKEKICPKPLCFNDCNLRGYCFENGICFCDYMYEGEFCEKEKICEEEESNLCLYLKVNSSFGVIKNLFFFAFFFIFN